MYIKTRVYSLNRIIASGRHTLLDTKNLYIIYIIQTHTHVDVNTSMFKILNIL